MTNVISDRDRPIGASEDLDTCVEMRKKVKARGVGARDRLAEVERTAVDSDKRIDPVLPPENKFESHRGHARPINKRTAGWGAPTDDANALLRQFERVKPQDRSCSLLLESISKQR